MPLPAKGQRVFLDGLPGGPWQSAVDGGTDSLLALEPPRLGGRNVPLPLGRAFTIAYTVREMPHEVDAELLAAPPATGKGSYMARLSGSPRRIQRRGAVRVPIHLMVRATVEGTERGDEVGEEPESVGAITENLSAGGALLRLATPVAVGTELYLGISCGGEVGTLDVRGRVVRADEQQGAEERAWRLGIAFHDLTKPTEDRLVRFLFERQRELRRREKELG
jgi:c-di-GMP-binding flagellar brake protein YcgR